MAVVLRHYVRQRTDDNQCVEVSARESEATGDNHNQCVVEVS